jgi:hypothetical protein
MKKGQEIKSMLKKINDDRGNKVDYLVQMKDCKVVENDAYVFPDLEVGHLTRSPHSLNDHSLNNLCNRLEIGTRYISKCLPVSQNLVAHNLNFWINNSKDKELMLRTYEAEIDGSPYQEERTVRAIMSNRYKRIDNDVVANSTLDKLMDMNAELKYAHYDRDTLNITAVLPKLEGEVVEGDVVQGGITITNSEIGGGSLIVKPFIYRLVCTNGMVAPEYLNQFYAKHVGKMIIDLDNDDQWKTIVDKMGQQLELVSNPELFQENVEKLKQATEDKINSHQVEVLAKKHGLSDDERAGVFERLNHYVGETFVTSKYDVANAITNIANDESKSDERARFLQELGGLVIFSNNPISARI